MNQLSYCYHLKITMDAPVQKHRFTLRCIPCTNARQQILHSEYRIAPADFISESRDHWGNSLLYGSCHAAHTSFEATFSGQIITGLSPRIPSENRMQDFLFQYPTELTAADDAIYHLADSIPHSTDSLTISFTVMDLVHRAIRYSPNSTTVDTTAAQALALGCGVCQDYAHIMLAVLRCLKIPCRYVVGMLIGEGKSHAWVEVLHQNNWYAFDPTNNQPITDSHIKISHGRDYRDCLINRGIFLGNANQETNVSVIVSKVN